MDIDYRIVIVLAPIVIAGSWAAFNIGAAALRQVQNFLNKEQRLEDLSLLYQCIRSLPEFLITSI